MRGHVYECGKCGLRTDRHMTRAAAERSGQIHRDEIHGGMHPMDEAILSHTGQMPTVADWRLFVLVAGLIIAGLVNKAVT